MKKSYPLLAIISSAFIFPASYAGDSVDEYLDLPLEDLLSLEVTSVAKKKQRLNEVAAAIFVITQEDIRRSGVTSIPEALRMAPGIQVSKMDNNKWAITSRGFNSQYVNKLLVMIDGRTVYTSSFSGVYWDVQDTMMEDIERIEVIRGPGATVWGANAVNGVINIITKQAHQTQGGLLVAGAGNEEKSFASLRYGTELGTNTFARFYVKYNDRDSSYAIDPALDNAGDDWQNLRGGFRLDSQVTEADHWTIQGDIYDTNEHQNINLWRDPADPANAIYAPFYRATNLSDKIDSSGWNLLAKWQHQISDQSNTTLQIYYDHTERAEEFVDQIHNTIDIDFQHQFRASQRHDVIWGLGYRHIADDFNNSFNIQFLPDSSNVNLYSAFAQDEIELVQDTLRLTLGVKYEHNDYTGNELQPSARLVWLPNDRNTLWASVSRAVRTPSRVEISGRITTFIIPQPPTFAPTAFHALGNEDFKSEELLAYEMGYRFKAQENLSFDLTLFHNEYDDLQNFEAANILDSTFTNNLSAYSYGLELVTEWRPVEWWRLQSSYSYIQFSAHLDYNSTDPTASDGLVEGSSPEHQFSLRSMMDLSEAVSLDFWLYYVDKLERTSFSQDNSNVSDYTSFNTRLAWRPRKNVELSLVGQNLFDSNHAEFVGENLLTRTKVERSIYGQIRWEF